MKRRGILLVMVLLSITWQAGTHSALGARETSLSADLVPQSALPQQVSGGWVIVDFPSYRGHHTSIAVDSHDLVHISHVHEGNLMYTRQYLVGDTIWWGTYTAVAASDIEDTSLALDENDRPYIAYYDDTTDNLCWAWSPSNDSVWYTGTLHTAGVVDGPSPSAVMRGVTLHVAYLNVTNANVEYIKIIPGGWPSSPQVVAGPHPDLDAEDISLALRSDGLPRITYSSINNELIYARYTGSAWYTDVIEGDSGHRMGLCNSLALDGYERPQIAYFDQTNDDLRFVWYGLLGWSVPAVVDDSLGDYCYISLDLDSAGGRHILYYNGSHDGNTSGFLRYARRRSGSDWSFETVDGPASSCGMHSDLALDSVGRPHASYYCGHLRYAHRLFTVYLPVLIRSQ